MASGHARVSLRNTSFPYENTATGRACFPRIVSRAPPDQSHPDTSPSQRSFGKKKLESENSINDWTFGSFGKEEKQETPAVGKAGIQFSLSLSLSRLKAEKDPGEEGGWSSFLFLWGFFQEMEGKSGDVKHVEEEEVVQDKASSGEAKSESSSETDELLLGGAKNDAAKQGDAGSPDLSMVQPWTNGATCNRCCQVCSFFLCREFPRKNENLSWF